MRRTSILTIVMALATVFLAGALLRAEEPAAGVAAGEPIAGGGDEGDVRFMLPAEGEAPEWTAAETARGYVVFTDSYLASFWPRQRPTREQIADALRCRLARSEYEPIQVGVCATGEGEALANVRLEVSIDLDFEVRRLHFRERTPTAKQLKHLGPTQVPYSLLTEGVEIETLGAGETGTWWITFHAKADTQPGTHTGSVKVLVEGKEATELALVVEVLPFELPGADIAYGMYYYRVTKLLQNEQYAERANRDQAAHGMNSATLYVQEPIKLEEGKVVFPKTYEERLANRMEWGSARADIPIMLMDYQLINHHSGRINDSLTEEAKADVARQYIAYAKEKGFPELLAYVQDEPSVDQPATYFPWVTGWKKSAMRTVAAMSGLAAAALGHLHDVWVVHTGQITRETVREARRQGAEVWTYTFAMGAYNALSNRYMAGLYTWGLGLRGNYHWAYYHNDHFVILEQPDPAPLLSWEGRREGVDDYRYLMLLERALARAEADDAVAREARAWLAELKGQVDLQFFHGFEGWVRVDGPFCWPAPGMEVADYDAVRGKATDYLLKLGIEEAGDLPPVPYERSGTPKWEAAPFEGKSVDACIAGLRSDDTHTRRSAAAALALRGEDAVQAIGALEEALDDPDVRMVALRALGAIGEKAGVAGDAVAGLFDHDDEFVRMGAAMALGGMGPDAVAGLREALSDRSPQVVQIAGEALAKLGEDAAPAVGDLIPLLASENSAVQRGAIKALEGIGPKAAPATAALAKVFEDSGCKDHYAAMALAAIGPAAESAVGVLETRHDKNSYYDAHTNYALFAITGKEEYLHDIMRILNDPGDRYVEPYTCELIGSFDERAAAIAPAVKEYIETHDKLGDGPRKHLENFLATVKAGGS